MPMRGELAVSAARLNGGPAANPGLFAVVVFCLTGLAVTMYFAVTAAPILLHQVGQSLAIAFCLTSSCFIALYFERAVPIVLLVSYLFQTMFVAMASSRRARSASVTIEGLR